jgi:hypothetical protein
MVKHTSNLGVFALASIVIFATILNGCASRTSRFILVQSRVASTTRNDNFAEVTKTPRYSNIVSQIHSVALSAPSSCANQSASSATGSASNTGDVVKTRCGVEMAEIERALVRQGFTVYSWNMVNNAIIANSHESATAVAKRLGAQVLFQVNSLERVIMIPGRDAQIDHNFQNSNASGESLGPLKLDEQKISKINAIIGTDELKRLPSATRLGAMLDINAVDSATGQTIWFYRWSKHEDSSKKILAKYLLQCWDYWAPWCMIEEGQISEPKNESQSRVRRLFEDTIGRKGSTEVATFSTDSHPASEQEATFSTNPRPASEQDVIYFELLRDVTADFVKRFSSGQ